MLRQPNPEAHGLVWKVVVNDYDAQDEFDMLPPLGVGRHKFEVWYSKVIDHTEVPIVAMGVRPPYTQTAIGEDGSWRTEVTQFDNNGVVTDVPVSVYTAYLTINGGMAIDGLNRIYVSECKDLEGFEIPYENRHFNVEVAAAGSMSTGFMAEPGLGKVTLSWEDQDANVDDILGYNIYRYTSIDGNVSEPLRINERLVDATTFVDYDVIPGINYNYYYKILRTNMAENSPSKVVSVTPLTASKGDANGSMTVDVADIVTQVNYITGGNPQPFIFEAADVNDDLVINVLDIVGTIRIIAQPQASSAALDEGVVKYWVEDGIVYMSNDIALGGIQLVFCDQSHETSFLALDDLNGFETVGSLTDSGYLFMAYSMSGRSIMPGTYAILAINGETADLETVICSDVLGHNVVTIAADIDGMAVVEAAQMRLPNPNPFYSEVNIPYVIGDARTHKVEICICDLSGRLVDRFATTSTYGEHNYTWHSAAAQGVYFAAMYIDGTLVQTAKLIKK